MTWNDGGGFIDDDFFGSPSRKASVTTLDPSRTRSRSRSLAERPVPTRERPAVRRSGSRGPNPSARAGVTAPTDRRSRARWQTPTFFSPSTATSTSRTRSRSTHRDAATPANSRVRRPAPTRSLEVPRRGPRGIRPQVDENQAARLSLGRLGIMIGVIVALFGVVVVKLVDVQFNQAKYWKQYGADARVTRDVIRVDRGSIFDRNGNALALSVYRPNVVADPTEVEDKPALARRLAPILDVPRAELLAKLKKTNHYQLLARNVDQKVIEKLKADGRDTPVGIYYEYGSERDYPGGDSTRAIVGRTFDEGRVDLDGKAGRYGIEATFDKELRGTPGHVIYEKDRAGGRIAGADRLVHQPTPGMNVYLTIDQALQYSTEQALIQRVGELGASEATAVITRPSTGEVLAMVTVAHDKTGKVGPTVDNRAATTVYEPGSVNKMLTIAGALEEGQISPETQRRVPDSLRIANKTFRDHAPHPDQLWTTADIISNSSNIGTIQIAQGLGDKKLDAYLRSFGLGSTTGSDIPGELRGLMPGLDQWSGTTLGSIAIGQTVAVTPLQMLAAFNVIANDGMFVAPHTIGATDLGNGKQTPRSAPPRRVVSAETARSMEAMLGLVVSDGTGKAAAVPGYEAWGKTGTARIAQENPTDKSDGYLTADGTYEYASTFVGGIKGADLSLIVTVKQPETSTSGGAAAAPVFSELAALTLRNLNIPPPPAEATTAPVATLSSPANTDIAGNPGSVTTDQQG